MSNQVEIELAEAKAAREVARAAMNAAKLGSKKWIAAEEDLNWWQGRVAYLECMR